MKATITTQGDPSVGIWGANDEVTLSTTLDSYDEEREDIRNILKKAWEEIYNEVEANVLFDDECQFCRKLLTECRCPDYGKYEKEA